MSGFYEDDEPLEKIWDIVERGRARRAKAEFARLLMDASPHACPAWKDNERQRAEPAQIKMLFGPEQTYRE